MIAVFGLLLASGRFALAAQGASTAQVEVHAAQFKTRWQFGRARWCCVQTENTATALTAEMNVRGMLSSRREGKAEYSAGIGAFQGKSAFDEVIKDAIQGHPVECWITQRSFDFSVRQRRWRVAEQAQHANTRRCDACSGISQPFADGIGCRVRFGGQSNHPEQGFPRLQHGLQACAILTGADQACHLESLQPDMQYTTPACRAHIAGVNVSAEYSKIW